VFRRDRESWRESGINSAADLPRLRRDAGSPDRRITGEKRRL
jgi:uncharacterized membrane protein